MTVALIRAIQNFVGLSTDTKPTAPPTGSTFLETDSGATYVYDGSAWAILMTAGPFRASATFTFTGAAGFGQLASPTCTFVNVTGQVVVEKLVPFCTVDLVSAGGGTLILGAVGTTGLFLSGTTAAASIDANKRWLSTGGAGASVAIPAAFKEIFLDDDIIGTVGTADITAGAIRFDCYWRPLSANGLVAPP